MFDRETRQSMALMRERNYYRDLLSAEWWIVITYHEHEPCKVFGPFLLETLARIWADQQGSDAYEVKQIQSIG